MESSAILVSFLLKTKLKPNTITLIYALCGVLGGILLAIPTMTTILIALFLFITKGILDWSDGHLARLTKQTSLTGSILDPYGARINSLGFWVGFSFYLANFSKMSIFYYFTPLYPLLLAANATFYANNELPRIIMAQTNWPSNNPRLKQQNPALRNTKKPKPVRFYLLRSLIKKFIYEFPDDRARTIDLICLLIGVEMFTGIFISWIIYALFIAKNVLIMLGSLYALYTGRWEKETADSLNLIPAE